MLVNEAHAMKAWRNACIVSFSNALPDFISGKQMPRDFLERCIANVERCEPRIKAFVTFDLKAARKAARLNG
jgi:hypothetical protein